MISCIMLIYLLICLIIIPTCSFCHQYQSIVKLSHISDPKSTQWYRPTMKNSKDTMSLRIKSSVLMKLRGGVIEDKIIQPTVMTMFSTKLLPWFHYYKDQISRYTSSHPSNMFNMILFALLTISTCLHFTSFQQPTQLPTNPSTNNQTISQNITSTPSTISKTTPQPLISTKKNIQTLQKQFLSVFWLARLADWLQGPYFYEIFASKILTNQQILSSQQISSLFLIGFLATGVCGPWMGRLVDQIGGKIGTLLFVILYSLGALSTSSNTLWILYLGRILSGLGTSLLFSAPEAWFVKEYQLQGYEMQELGKTFAIAFAVDSLIAIFAGKIATIAASKYGPIGPFFTSISILIIAGILVSLTWKNHTVTMIQANETNQPTNKESDQDIIQNPQSQESLWTLIPKLIIQHPSILSIGLLQAFFEGAMYIFVLQWPPAIKQAMEQSTFFQQQLSMIIPYGNIFSCLMASCLIGSTLFNRFQRQNIQANHDQQSITSSSLTLEQRTQIMLFIASLSMLLISWYGLHNLWILISMFVCFEICVGFYFPMIGTLRSKYFPSNHRSLLTTFFGVPLNMIVIFVFLSIQSLGISGSFLCASLSLALAGIALSYLGFKK